MTETESAYLDLASQALDYPDQSYFNRLTELRAQLAALPESSFSKAYNEFLDQLEKDGTWKAQQKFVSVFDHEPETSLYLAWHRYGNDRGQGKALAALNGLYRAAGLEPDYGSMPDYLPRVLEFMANSEDWAIEVMLDGFGPEMDRLFDKLAATDSLRSSILKMAFQPLKERWPNLFKPRSSVDPTIRPMARPEPEMPILPTNCSHFKQGSQEDKI